MKPFVIGISGASCSGKTLIANRLADKLNDREIATLKMDNYYYDLGSKKPEERALVNFDKPDAIDFDLFIKDVKELLEERKVLIPEYDFKTHTRKPLSEGRRSILFVKSANRPVIIIEGLHVFFNESLRKLVDLGVYIDAGMDVCLSRRIERDTMQRGRTRESVYRQFSDTVVPMYERYVFPTRNYADLIVNGEEAIERSVQKIMRELESILLD